MTVATGRESLVLMGIDPGLANTGWGIVEKRGSRYRALAYGCITTGSDCDMTSRLKTIYDDLSVVISRYRPSELGIESIYFGANTKSAFATGQARGAALIACASNHLVVGEYTPMQIKQAVVGTGTADKDQVAYMVRAILQLDHEPHPDHASDALAAAICHGNSRLLRNLDMLQGNRSSGDVVGTAKPRQPEPVTGGAR